MNEVWIINFNEWIEIQVYKCWGYSHDNIGDEIIDWSAFVWMEAYLMFG